MKAATMLSLASMGVASAALVTVWGGPSGLDMGPVKDRLALVKDNLEALTPAAQAIPKVIYLNREGVELIGGRDDARKNRSSLVPGDRAAMPAFTGSDRTWKRFVKCVEAKLVDFDVSVVDQRPVAGPYMMVAVGGTAKDLGAKHDHRHSIGLAPYNGQPIPNAVVLVFARSVSNRVTDMCETAGQEIGHAYGLDHARHCSDLMTYMPRCGARAFVDKDLTCGEHSGRACKNGEAKQNSYAHMMRVLGPRV